MAIVTHNNKSEKAGKQGPKGHFQGHKLDFLVARTDTYQQALDTKTMNYFYDTATREFIAKYGESEPFNLLVTNDPPDPVDIDFDDVPESTREEAAVSALIYQRLRMVRDSENR